MSNIHPFLWFDTEAEEATEFYAAVFPNSRVMDVARYGNPGPGPSGSVMTVHWAHLKCPRRPHGNCHPLRDEARSRMTGIEPELWVEGAGAAVAFYRAAFDATILHCVGDGDDIVAQLGVGAARFWVTEANSGMQRYSPQAISGTTSRTLLIVDDPEAVLRRAVAAGATETAPVEDEHGWRLGRAVDPFGHEWEIGRPLGAWPPTVPQEPDQRR